MKMVDNDVDVQAYRMVMQRTTPVINELRSWSATGATLLKSHGWTPPACVAKAEVP